MVSLDAFLRDAVLAEDIGEVLVLGYGLPSVFQEYKGSLTYIGLVVPQGPVSSTDYNACIRKSAPGITLALEQVARKRTATLALVYLDGDHTIGSLVRQINAAVELSDADTLFVLPGAVPPARDMAYPKAVPGQSWWVGEVWTLWSILAEAGAAVKTHTTNPLGTLFASGVQKLDLEHAARLAQELQDYIGAEEWANYFTHATLTELKTWILDLRAKRRKREYIRVVVDPAAPERTSSTIIDQSRLWQRINPTFVEDLSGAKHDLSMLHEPHRLIHAVQVDEFQSAFIAGRDAILVDSSSARQMSWYGKNTELRSAKGWMKHVSEEEVSESDIITSLTTIDAVQYLHRSFFDSVIDLREPVFLGTPDEHPNYGMWLLYSVPGVRLFKKWNDRYIRYMAPQNNPWQRKMLLDLGLREDELVEHRLDSVYRAPAVATMRQTFRDLALSSSDAEAFDAYADEAVAQGHGGPERIFISRLSKTREGGHRGLRNEEALIDALKPLGFTPVEPERYPLAEQAGLFRSASIVIGLGGAAMFNVAFCRPGTTVIDIESGLGFVDAHCNLFASRGTNYGIVIGSVDYDHPSPYQKTWTIDINGLVRLLRQHL